MNWYSAFYLFTIADGIKTFSMVMMCIFTVIVAIAAIAYFMNTESGDEDAQKMSRKWVWWSAPFAVIFWIAYIFIPSRKDLVLIIAGGAVGEFVMNDSNAKQLPADVVRFLRKEILDATADMTDDAKSALGLEKINPIDSARNAIKQLSKEELEKLVLEKVK